MTTKKWYTRRRYWSLAILATLVYFCLIPSPLRVSPETTGFTEPLLPNGDVDYFGAYERMYIHKLSPPEDNGQRLLIAALGPRVLEQVGMMDAVPWEQLPTHEMSKKWFEEYWVPLCEHMFIDPYERPRFLDSLTYHRFMKKEWEVNNQDENASYDYYKEDEELRKQLAATPWTAEEHPDIARWLKERSPVLDLFGVAVRKPNFACYRWQMDNLFSILLPDVQHNRQFARELQIRITAHLGKGDVDSAWDDVMSMLYLSRKHYLHDPIVVINLVGCAVERNGYDSARLVLQHGNPSPEQLERFAKDLNALPRKTVLSLELERYFLYSTLQMLQHREFISEMSGRKREPITDLTSFFLYLSGDGWYDLIALLPIDRNIAGKRITEFLRVDQQLSSDVAWNASPIIARQYFEDLNKQVHEIAQQRRSHWFLLQIPLIRTRSEFVADSMVAMFLPALLSAQNGFDNANTQFDLLRLSIALERYNLANGEYPETLDALLPTYLEEVPLEPLTGRKSFVYKPSPDAETAFLLHSSEWSDDDGRTRELFVRMKK